MRIPLPALLVILLGASAGGDDWACFRGPGRDGKSVEKDLPLEWGRQKNIKWKVPMPRPGNGSPIVVGQRVFVTSAQDKGGHQRTLLCFDRITGRQLWAQTVAYEPVEPMHGTNPHCASTPACDGQRVIVWHGSAGLYCYDLEGKQLWKTDLGAFRHIWGYAASPVIHGNAVYLNCGPGARSSVAAISKIDGTVLWKTEEPGGADDKSPVTRGWIGSWTTPLISKVDGQEQLVIAQPLHVNAYDLMTGKVIWTCAGTGPLAYTDAIAGPDVVIAFAGFGGPAIGLKPGGSGDITESRRLWRITKNPQRISNGILVGPHVFMAGEGGIIQCFEARTGKELWKHSQPGHAFWSGMVMAPDRIYLTSQKGTTFVFSPSPEGFKLLATNDLGEHTNATPAPSNGQIFIRTWNHLYCVEAGSK